MIARQIFGSQQPRTRRIVDVVIDVADEIGDAHDLPFDRARTEVRRHPDRRAGLPLRMLRDAVAHFPRQVEPFAVVLEHVDDAEALLVVVEAAGHQLIDHPLAGVPERRVAEIVPERDRFGELFVQAKDLGDRARDLRDLERVRQARAVVIAGRGEEDLRLVLQPAERLAVDDAVAIALKRRTHLVLALLAQASARVGALGRLRREDLALALLELLTDRHKAFRKLSPCASGPTPNTSASVCPTSANVRRVPRSTPWRTAGPSAKTGTYSRVIGA